MQKSVVPRSKIKISIKPVGITELSEVLFQNSPQHTLQVTYSPDEVWRVIGSLQAHVQNTQIQKHTPLASLRNFNGNCKSDVLSISVELKLLPAVALLTGRTCIELDIVNIYWNTIVSSLTANTPNTQDKPRRGNNTRETRALVLKKKKIKRKIEHC